MSKPAIEVKNVRKRFYIPHDSHDSLKMAITQALKPKARGGDEFYALNDISFNVEQGDFFGVLGRNGSGKSTLLKIISDIYRPTSGSVKHRGKLVSFIELGVGFKKELTGKENVFLNSALLGFSKSEIERMYDDIVSFAELEDFMDQKLKNYSSGMKVRLAFSVAIRAKADILILDEVLAVGDAAFKKKCGDYFASLKDKKKTVILVTHGMGAVRRYCNKAIVIEKGKVIFNGTGSEAADEYTKLFVQSENNEDSIEVEALERNNGKISINSVDVLASNNEIIFKTNITGGEKDTKDFKVSFRVMDQGRAIAGADSVRATNGQHLSIKASQESTIVFKSPNLLADKTYTVNILISSIDGKKHYASWKNATSFISTNKDMRAPVLLPTTLSVE